MVTVTETIPKEMPEKAVEPVSAYPPELTPQNMELEPYSVFVQIEYRIGASDGPDAVAQIAMDLGQGRSYKHYTEISMAINARPTAR